MAANSDAANSGATSLGERIRAARARGVDRLDAELLCAFVLDADRSRIIAHPEFIPDAVTGARLDALLAARARGIPFAHLRGQQAFHALTLRVTADVLIPRPDTETLVDAVLARCDDAPRCVLDLGTGSGAIALALAIARPTWTLLATDRSASALAVAEDNIHAHGIAGRVRTLQSDWYEALGELRLAGESEGAGDEGPGAGDAGDDDGIPRADPRFDVIVSNPPYIAEGDPELDAEVARFEPAQALLSGSDGLDALRSIFKGARAQLRPGGLIAVEHGHRQREAVRALARAAGLEGIETVEDLAGRPRATLARRPDGAAVSG